MLKLNIIAVTGDFLLEIIKMGKRLAFLLVLTSINLVFAAKELTFAGPENKVSGAEKTAIEQPIFIYEGAVAAKPSLPGGKERFSPISYRVADIDRVVVTAYSSTIAETDETPFITATGKYVYPGMAASNILPIGTKFRLPQLFGDRIFVVEDRMNSRYNGKKWVDIWFDSQEKAIKFGKRISQIEILEE